MDVRNDIRFVDILHSGRRKYTTFTWTTIKFVANIIQTLQKNLTFLGAGKHNFMLRKTGLEVVTIRFFWHDSDKYIDK